VRAWVHACVRAHVRVCVRPRALHTRPAEVLPPALLGLHCSEADVKAAAEKGELLVTVGQDNRLNNRFLDLRTPANQAIFKIQSGVCQVTEQACACVLWGEGARGNLGEVGNSAWFRGVMGPDRVLQSW